MDESIKNENIKISTYVPVSNKLNIRKEIEEPPPKHVSVNKVFKKNDRFIFQLKHRKILKDFFNNYKLNPDIILHAHSLFSNGYIAYKSFLKFGTPYIVAVRATDLNVFFKKLVHLRRLGVNILLNASRIVFISYPYKDECINKYIPIKYRELIERKSMVIPNGINNFWFDNLRNNTNKLLDSSLLKLTFVGDGSNRKNLEMVLKVCNYLEITGTKIKLSVVGNIEDKSIENKYKFVQLKGYLGKESLIKIYENSDIFILLSKRETFGLVYPEAMTQGLPVIYTKDQGFDRHFENGTVGYAVEINDETKIADKIIKIADNYNYFSKNALKLVGKFKWEKIAERYKLIYEEIKKNQRV